MTQSLVNIKLDKKDAKFRLKPPIQQALKEWDNAVKALQAGKTILLAP